MGEISVAVNDYVRDKRRFADVFNGLCFGGETIIKPEDLEDASEHYTLVSEGGNAQEDTERIRDVKMRLKAGGALRLLAIENQSFVDYTMPFRCMEYDCLEYGRQLGELKARNKQHRDLKNPAEWLSGIHKSDLLSPMYTVCIYHGEEVWDGPRTLREMMYFGEDADGLSNLFSDYAMRLFCINECDNFDMFHTELREVFAALNYRSDKTGLQKLMEDNEAYHHLDRDSVRALSVLLKQPKIWENREKYMRKNGAREEYDMCVALRELKEEGRLEGVVLATKIVSVLRENNTLDNEAVAKLCACGAREVETVRSVLGI